MNSTVSQVNEQTSLTVVEIIRRTAEFFRTKDIDSPRLTIEYMLCEVLGCNRVGLYLHHDKPLQSSEIEALRKMVRRRGRREPLQYILGSTEFYGMTMKVSPDVLIPRPETELLVERAEKEMKKNDNFHNEAAVEETARNSAEPQEKYLENRHNRALRILDVGTGSGCIAIALAKLFPAAMVTAIDISRRALAVAQENAVLNAVKNIEFEEWNILDGWKNTEKFDVVVSNPPYISSLDVKGLQPEVGLFEPLSALTDNADGLTFYRRFAEIFPDLLTENGCFFVEIGFGQAEVAATIFTSAGFSTEVQRDYADIPRVLAGRRAK